MPLTREFLGEMLVTQRASVTLAVGKIEATGAPRTGRGGVQILDVAKLESLECGCYCALQRRYRDLAEGYANVGHSS